MLNWEDGASDFDSVDETVVNLWFSVQIWGDASDRLFPRCMASKRLQEEALFWIDTVKSSSEFPPLRTRSRLLIPHCT
jgi:hypothetical protein